MSEKMDEAKKQMADAEKAMQDAVNTLKESQKLLISKLEPLVHKQTKINDEQAIATVTKGGIVMVQFVSIEEAQKFYDKL